MKTDLRSLTGNLIGHLYLLLAPHFKPVYLHDCGSNSVIELLKHYPSLRLKSVLVYNLITAALERFVYFLLW